MKPNSGRSLHSLIRSSSCFHYTCRRDRRRQPGIPISRPRRAALALGFRAYPSARRCTKLECCRRRASARPSARRRQNRRLFGSSCPSTQSNFTQRPDARCASPFFSARAPDRTAQHNDLSRPQGPEAAPPADHPAAAPSPHPLWLRRGWGLSPCQLFWSR